MEDISQENLNELATTFYQWVRSTSFTVLQIKEYIRLMHKEDAQLSGPLLDEINSLLKQDLIIGLEKYVSKNIFQLLNVEQLYKSMGVLAEEGAQNFINLIKGNFPDVTLELAPQAVDWVKEWINTQHNLFMLQTYDRLFDYFPYLISLNNAVDGLEVIKSLRQESSELLEEIYQGIESNNYEDKGLDNSLKGKVDAFLSKIIFLPKEVKSSMAKKGSFPQLLSLIEQLNMNLNILEIAWQVNSEAVSKELLEDILWDQLVTQAQIKYLATEQKVHYQPNQEDYQIAEYFKFLNKLFAIDSIQSGTMQNNINNYLASLSSDQKNHFKIYLEDFIKASPLVATLFGLVDVNYFLTHIKESDPAENKADFVKSLEDRVLPEFWPVTQKAMLVIATLF